MAGPPSIGRPNPSSTRPSSAGPTRSKASFLRETTRSPSCKPSISSKGMDNTRSFRNPITWDRIERPEEVRTSQKSPIEVTGPREAISSPTISVTSPIQGSSSMAGTCRISSPMAVLAVAAMLSPQLVDQAALDLGHLRIHRCIQDALRGLEKDLARIQAGIRHQHQVFRRSGLFQIFADQAF